MTPTQILSSKQLRRSVGATLVVGSTLLGLSISDSVDAAPKTTSEVIAAEAVRALDALQSWEVDENPAEYVQFLRSRDRTAEMTARDLEIAPESLTDAWAAADTTKQEAVLAAMTQLGVPYRSMQSEEGVGFDCSGLTIWAFAEAGVEIPRISGDQIRAAADVDHDAAEPGDLVYYPGHVSIYLGADTMVHSPNSGNHVEARHIPTKSLRYGDIITP